MTKELILTAILSGTVASPIRAMDTVPPITIYMEYDARIPNKEVFWAATQTARIFSKISIPVQFRSARKAQPAGRSSLELDMYVSMDIPVRAHSDALGISHPFRQDGDIEVFYSRIQNYSSDYCRSMLLAYIMAHEIAHTLEGLARHSPAGVMKAEWDSQDLKKIRVGNLEFDSSDVELIRAGIEKRVNENHSAQLTKVSKMVR